MNLLRNYLEESEFFHSIELVLGRDHSQPEAMALLEEASRAGDGPKIISVTDLAAGSPALGAAAVVDDVQRRGLTPLVHITGRDSNRAGIESRLHELARRDVENVLALTGDMPRDGHGGRSRGVFDLDSVQILWLIRAMTVGFEYPKGRNHVRTTPFPFLPGAVVNPYKMKEADQMMQLYKLELKLSVGARFVVTQVGFNLRKLNELRQYLFGIGMDSISVVANIYVPTPTVAGSISRGELAGCYMAPKQCREFEKMTLKERLERGALLLAAARGLGFSGAHLGGFGLAYRQFLGLVERAREIGGEWRRRIDELGVDDDTGFYLFRQGSDGLSDTRFPTERNDRSRTPSPIQRASRMLHKFCIREESLMGNRLASYISGSVEGATVGALWRRLLAPAALYRRQVMGCQDCGDCVQDHLEYAGCPVKDCAKGLRNGPCGGSGPDGSCEAEGVSECLWNRVYQHSLSYGVDPGRFRRVFVPPRNWALDRTNALVNRFSGSDNLKRRVIVSAVGAKN